MKSVLAVLAVLGLVAGCAGLDSEVGPLCNEAGYTVCPSPNGPSDGGEAPSDAS